MLLMNGLGVKKLATTGYAATLIDGQTIHSYFTINHLLKCSLQYDSSNWHSIKQTNVIIIDECSLRSDELLNLIDEILVKKKKLSAHIQLQKVIPILRTSQEFLLVSWMPTPSYK